MKKIAPLVFSCLLILIVPLGRSAVPAQEQDDPIERLLTVQSRRDALAQATIEKEQWRNAGDPVLFVRASNRIAELHLKLCELNAAVEAANESLDTAQNFAGTSNATLLVDTLILAGRSNIRRNENRTALSQLGRALKLSQDLQYADGQAQSLAQTAVAYFELGEHDDAAAKNNDALKLLQQHQNKPVEARALTTHGEILMVSDRDEEATAALKSAESLWRSLGDADELANNLVNQGFLFIRQGQWHAALGLLNEAQSLVPEKEAEPYVAGKIATTYGEVYEAYGQLETSLSYYQQALSLYRDFARDKRATIDAANLVGRTQARLRDYAAAQQQINEALQAALQTENNLNIGLCHESLGVVSLEAGSYETARNEFMSSIYYLTRTDSQRELARVQTYLGQTEYLLGNLAQAAQAYDKALASFGNVPNYTYEAALRFGVGKLELKRGNLKQAEAHLERSIELTEQLRMNASSRDLRSSFLASVHDRYETYVELMMTRSFQENSQALAIKAFEVSESGRARALLDSLHDYPKELRKPRDPLLVPKEEQLLLEEQQLIDKRARLVGLNGVEKEKNEIEKKLTAIKAEHESLQARISGDSNFENLLTPITYQDTRNQLITDETSVLSYSLGDSKSFAWLLTEGGLQTYELSDKTSIHSAANQLIVLLRSPSTTQIQLQTAINEVSRLVLEPVSTNLRGSRLIIVADGILQYIPFQILKSNSNSNEPLIARFEVVNAPSASALAMVKRERNDRKPGAKLLIGFGDPVFSSAYTPQGFKADDAISTTRGAREGASRLGKLPRLFNARRELRSIEELVSYDSKFYVEYDATRDNLLNANLSDYRILHVVTHGIWDTDQPELSGLAFSMVSANQKPLNGFLSLAEIYNLRAPVDLVVLSACHTALGKEVRGEGLVGLTRGFMYAGASGVVASLWQVDDRATAELMKYFYTNMLQHGMQPPAALRAAQNQIRSQPEYSSPYYWAGFTYQGDYDLNIKSTSPAFTPTYIALVSIGVLFVLFGAFWYLRKWRMTAKTANG